MLIQSGKDLYKLPKKEKKRTWLKYSLRISVDFFKSYFCFNAWHRFPLLFHAQGRPSILHQTRDGRGGGPTSAQVLGAGGWGQGWWRWWLLTPQSTTAKNKRLKEKKTRVTSWQRRGDGASVCSILDRRVASVGCCWWGEGRRGVNLFQKTHSDVCVYMFVHTYTQHCTKKPCGTPSLTKKEKKNLQKQLLSLAYFCSSYDFMVVVILWLRSLD